MTQQEAEVRLRVNNKEALEKINKLEAQAVQLRKQFQDCFRRGDTRGLAETTSQLNKVNKEMANMRTNASNIQAAMKRIDQATPRELQKTIKMINSELNSGRVVRGSKEWQEYCNRLKQVKGELKKVNAEMQEQASKASGLGSALNSWYGKILGIIGAVSGLTMVMKEAVQNYANIEGEMANVRKFTGMSADEVNRLNEEFKKLDTRASREELNQLAQEAGRLGKTSVEDVLGFTKAAMQLKVALDDLGEGATLEISKLTSIFGDEAKFGTEAAMLKVGSVVNELSQNCSAAAPYLVDFSQRLAGVGAQAKLTIPQIMAFASVLDAQGQNVEAAATAFSQLVMKLYQEPAKFAGAVGLDVKNFTDMLKTDANQAVLTFLEALNKVGSFDSLAPVLKDLKMSGARVSAVLAALAGNIQFVKDQQVAANQAFDEGTSITKEYDVQNNTVQASLDKAKKKFMEMSYELGEKLVPAMKFAIDAGTMLMGVLNVIVGFVSNHATAILQLTAAYVAYTTAANYATIATKAHSAWLVITSKSMQALQGVTLLAKAAFFALTGHIGKAKEAFVAFNAVTKLNPWAVIAAGVAAVVVGLVSLMKKMSAVAEAQKEMARVSKEAAEKVAEERVQIDLLVRAAQDERLSLEERQQAIKKLNAIIPGYNAQLDATTGKYRANKKALDEYIASLQLKYQLEGAKDVLRDIGKQKADLLSKRRELEAEKATNNEILQNAANYHPGSNISTTGTAAGFGGSAATTAGYSARNNAIDAETKNIARDLENLDAKMEYILGEYGKDLEAAEATATSVINNSDDSSGGGGGGGGGSTSPSGGSGSTKATDAVKDALKAEEEAMEEFQALNEINYEKGAKTYAQYLDTKRTLDMGLIDNQMEALDKLNATDTKEYASLLQKKRDLRKQWIKEAIEEEETLATSAQTENTLAYATGEKDYEAYLERKHELDLDLLSKQIEAVKRVGGEESKEYADLLLKRKELEDSWRKEKIEKSLEALEQEYEKTKAAAIDMYADSQSQIYLNDKAYKQLLFEAEVDFLRRKMELYKDDAKKRAEVERDLNDLIKQDQLEKAKETRAKRTEFEKSYLGDKLASYRESLKKIEDLEKEGVITAQEAMTARLDELAKYLESVGQGFSASVVTLAEDIYKLINGLGGKMTDVVSSALSVISSAFSQYSSFVNVERDLEIAKMEKYYDDEIEKAGSNTKKKEKLEKEKEEATAKVKKKYNDRAMKIEVAQAIAQTAQGAIAAYSSAAAIPVTGWILAPIAAAMATAAGMVQVALIKKQHDAQAAGYYEGGFTGGNRYRKEAGVVHEGEFVANHNAVNNPQLAPVFRLLDYAQSNNTVGSLSARDVSYALGQAPGVSARGGAVTQGGLSSTATPSADLAAIDKLNAILENGISAEVVMDTERGLYRKLKKYEKLINNPKR